MLSFKRIFKTRQQALEVYKTQLSAQMIYVESFEAYPAGTEVKLELQNSENRQTIVLDAKVERVIGKAEVIEKKFGQRPGLILRVAITQDLIAPMRAFFLAESAPAAAPVRPKFAEPVRPKVSDVKSSEEVKTTSIPLENLNSLSPSAALAEVNAFLNVVSKGSLYQIFNLRPGADRKQLRGVYNKLVRVLHPDRHESAFGAELIEKLEDAYQIVNEAYESLQNPIKNSIYLEISRANRVPDGMSLNDYKKFLADYRIKNAANISLADELAQKAEQALMAGNKDIAEQNVKLALQYDPYHEGARSIKI